MINAVKLRLDAILSLCARADDAEFERKHPRAKDGKFGSGGGGGRGSTEISQKPKGSEAVEAEGGGADPASGSKPPSGNAPPGSGSGGAKKPPANKKFAYADWLNGVKANAAKRISTALPPDLDAALPGLKPEAQKVAREMWTKSAAALPGFQDGVNEIAATVGGTPMVAPLKKATRSVEKILADYNGDPKKLKDIVRGTILVDSMAGIHGAIEAIGKKYKIVGGVRNLFPGKDGRAPRTRDGYRDFKCNVELPNGVIGEIQVHIPEILHAKNNGEGHHIYNEIRSLDAKFKEARSPEDVAKYGELIKRSRAVYNAAWVRAKGKSSAKRPGLSSMPLSKMSPTAQGAVDPSSNTRTTVAPPSGVRRATTGTPSTSQRPKGNNSSSAIASPPTTTPTRSIPQSGKKSTLPSTAKQAGAAIAAMRGAKPAAGTNPAETANEAAEAAPPHYTPSTEPAARALRQQAAAASERTNQRRVAASINRTMGKAGKPEFEVLNGGTRVKKTPNPREALAAAEKINSALPTYRQAAVTPPARQPERKEGYSTGRQSPAQRRRSAPRRQQETAAMASTRPIQQPKGVSPEEHMQRLERAENNLLNARQAYHSNQTGATRAQLTNAKRRLYQFQEAAGVPEHERVKVDSRRRAKARSNRARRTPVQRINALLSQWGIGA